MEPHALDRPDAPPAPWTTPHQPASRSALDPTVEEISWIGWQLDAADPARVDEHAHLANTAGFVRMLETIWSPGRAVAITELESIPSSDLDAPVVVARLLVGCAGSTGHSAVEAEAVRSIVNRFLAVDGGPFSVSYLDPSAFFEADPSAGTDGAGHGALIRHRAISLGGDDHGTIDVVSRFNPPTRVWAPIADRLADHPHPVRVRATVLATEASTDDWLQVHRQLDLTREVLESPGARFDLLFNAERAKATLLHLQSTMSSTALVGEISVSSAAYLPETFLRSIATCFTSELDVQHRPGGASVATDLLLAGGFEIERDPEGLLAALAAGLPLRGGTGPRTINDLLTLAESPLGWPIPIGRPIPGLPSSIAHEQAPERLTVTDQEPETIDAIGSTRRGDPIGLPVDLRSRHTVITGSWGSGKSTVASHLMVQDLQHRRPFMLIDPHGSLADHVILWAQRLGRDYIHLDPENPTTGTIAPFDLLAPDGSNLEHVEGQISRYLDAVAASLPDPTFASVRWYSIAQSWALVQAAHGASTEEAMVWLNDGDLLVEMAHHPLVPVNARRTLEAVAGPRASRDAAEIRTWVSSKFHALVSGPIRRLLAAPGAAPTVMELVAQDATVVCNLRSLSPGEAAILGHLTASAAIAGVMDRPPAARSLYSCFMDEAHRFPADSLRRGLTEGRKFGLGLVLIAQSHSQFSAELADLVSVAGTQIFFRATPETAARASLFLDAPASLLRLPDLDGVVLVNGEQPVTISVPPYSEPDDPAPGAESAERIGEPSEDDQPMPGDPSPPPPIDAKRRTLTRLIQKENQRLMAAQPENEDRLDVLEPPEEA